MTIVSCSQAKLEHLNPDELIAHQSFSQVVKVEADKLVFISGQVAFDKMGKIQGTNFEAQLKQSLQNVEVALISAESCWEKVIQMRIYVVDLKPEHRFLVSMALDSLYNESAPPANTLLGVQSLARKDLKVEIEVVAVSN